MGLRIPRRDGQLRWLVAYVALITGLGLAYYAWGSGRSAVVAAIGVSSAAAILAGVLINHPRRRTPWLMLAGATLVNAWAWVVFAGVDRSGPFDQYVARLVPVFALHLVMFVLLVGAFIALSWPQAPTRRLPVIIDGAIVVLGAGLLSWVVIADPWTSSPDLPTAQVAARLAYVLRDVLVLAALARLVTAVRWSASVALLGVGTVGLLTYDTLLRIGLIHGDWLWGGPIGVGWLAFYGGLGAAALVPSMTKISTAAPGRNEESGALPLAFVAVSAVIPFALLLGKSLPGSSGSPGSPGSPPIIAVASALMLALVLTRLTLAIVHLRRSTAEAIAIRDASTDLVAASDVPAIEAAVRSALRQLLRPNTTFSVHLISRSDAGPPSGQPRLLMPLARTEPTDAHAPDALLVLAPPDSLAVVRRPLKVIAAQASLALARLQLTDEVINNRSDQYFRALVHNASDVILIVDDAMTIRYASPSATRMFGPSTMDGALLPDLLAPQDRPVAHDMFEEECRRSETATVSPAPAGEAGRDRTPEEPVQVEWHLAGPERRRVEMSCLDLRSDEAIRGFVVTLRDVTERRQLEERLTEQAMQDPLTGLGNRSLFTARVEAAVVNTAHAESAAAVLFVDLDDFKIINDGYGHVIGDAYLTSVAQRLSDATRDSAVLARFGGDEFAVLVQGTGARDAGERMAGRIVATLAEPITVQGTPIRCGVSVGVATTDSAHTSQELLRHADLALYEAKAGGKHQWRRYDPTMASVITDRLELRATLSEALETDALRLEYQPIVALDSGRTVGLEALMRWEHPTRGRLGPDEFIEVAEESGLIGPIGEWALRSATREAVRWAQVAPDAPPYVSVNVSAKQFTAPNVFDMVRRQLEESGLPPHRLLVEITESVLLHDDEAVIEGLRRLRELGVRVAIDDFGTGYSALSYLQRVPLDALKLDRLFTRTMGSSTRQRELVAGIVQLAATLGLEIIAEGIETVDERRLARQIGCPYGQGYLFSRPLPPPQALRWVAEAGADPIGGPIDPPPTGRTALPPALPTGAR